ncbi:MAG TPA: tRNA-dihydrouridine synthase family protein [Capsulimonadaceae bacterium]|jgi:tRNA-dihydrouridine synthase C
MLYSHTPALLLAPMEGMTDAPMRAVQGETGSFSFAVSEFMRISSDVPGIKAIRRHVPELVNDSRTPTGLLVQVQLLGGDAVLMAESAAAAVEAGALSVDINFGCPAPTVNRHDGGATLLKYPMRIREIVSAIRGAVPKHIPVSAKLRLGWDSIDAIVENADMAVEGGASWLTIHGRTRAEGYKPPAHWEPIGVVRERVGVPVVANGDIWSLGDFRRCREVTGCNHFMLGRGALANPLLSHQVSHELGLGANPPTSAVTPDFNWLPYLRSLECYSRSLQNRSNSLILSRIKQWLMVASRYGCFLWFDDVKRLQTITEVYAALEDMQSAQGVSV